MTVRIFNHPLYQIPHPFALFSMEFELDKNRNVDQQKALIFESETCKYDVILGADFLTKAGIDVKNSTGTIEWFENELPLLK